MSEPNEAETMPKPRKGKGLIVKLLAGIVLVGAGGGGTYALVQSGMVGGHAAGKGKPEKNEPKLIRKGEEDPYAAPVEGGEGEAPPEIDGEGGSEYRTSYYNFADDFTSNLKNSDALVQFSLACSTRRDGRVLIWLKKHELAIRSAVLVVLADTPEDEVILPAGKQRLQQRITATINQVLNKTEGFGGIDAVYFKTFLVQ
jgi:flagellar protein FliL